MAPKPKVPPEYAKVAKKLSSELPNIAGEFDKFLDDSAKALKGNLDSRSVDLPNETVTHVGSSYDGKSVIETRKNTRDPVKAAGVFAKTEGTKTPDVNNPADFEVAMDQLLEGFKEPKAVEGSGAMTAVYNHTPGVPFGYKTDVQGTGVLTEGYKTSHMYTPNQRHPGIGDTLETGEQVERATRVDMDNELINEGIANREMANPNEPRLFATSPDNQPGDIMNMGPGLENIPAVAATVGAGVLLSSQNAQAKEPTLDQELEVDMGSVTPPKISLTSKVNARQGISPDSVTENGNSSVILDEIQTLATRAKHNLTTFAGDVAGAYNQYRAEKDVLAIKAVEFINNTEHAGKTLSDDDKELMKDFVDIVEGSPAVALSGVANAGVDVISKFNHEVIQPLKNAARGVIRDVTESRREIERTYAPSLSVLHDTLAYPLLGSTGWNVSPDSVGITDSDEDMEKGMAQLDPEVRKLFDDKSALLGTAAGKAMFVFANKFADLPLWVVGGTSKTAMMLAGAASEAMRDDKDADLVKGGVIGAVGGKVMETVLAPVAKKAISLLKNVKLDPSMKTDMFGKVTFDDNATHVKKVWNAWRQQGEFEPMLMMTSKGANMMADSAEAKARPDVSDAFKTQVVAPQALVLSIDAATGKPRLFGVKDGLYGELTDFVNPEGRPVLINQIAKNEWMENQAVRDAWNKLIDPKRRTPNTRAAGIDEWTPDVIPPENPALVLAWKNMRENGGGFAQVYEAGTPEFNRDLLRSRSLVRVEFTHPDGRADTGVGFWGYDGSVVFAPDATENIPGAIPRDLTFKQTRINPNVDPSGIKPENQAWEIQQLTDDEMMALVNDMRARNELDREIAAEAARGGALTDGVPAPANRPPNDFDVGMNAIGPGLAAAGSLMADNPGATAVAAAIVSFLPPAKQAIGKALTKMNNAAGAAGLLADTVYGEVFKVDASIIAFSLRHYKRLTNDLNKQLVASFRDAAQTPQQREQFNNQLKYFIENHQANNPAPLPPQLQPAIQQKVQKFVAERNYEWALIEQLGGTVPDKTPTGNAELERLFALDYFRKGGINYEEEGAWKKLYNHVTGYKTSDNQWIDRIRKNNPYGAPDRLINLLTDKEASKVSKNTRAYDGIMGRMSTEMEMASDYMNRKLQLNQLAFMKVLADNTQASSPIVNQALGHTNQVTFNGSGLLKGKFVSDETFKAIHTYPKDQEVLQNTMLGIVNMIKFNKTVLNPTTWVKNTMGNVWGVMNSNIVSSWNMAYRMPKGVLQMRKDLAKFNADVMANDPAVHRVHKTLKYGLLGNEFESMRPAMQDVLENLADPKAYTSQRSWGEKIANGYFMAKDNTLGAMAHTYSKIDMATKYSLYVNGLERWGIDLATNKLRPGVKGRRMAADLLGASVAGNFTITDDVITDMIEREIVRRIHLSLPMVDRIGPVATSLNKLSPVTSPWLRTASELTRTTLQMPYRMFNEKGYAVNALKTGSFLGTILGVNKALRLHEGISDEQVDDAKRLAPKNITNYMPGATATKFYVGKGEDRGLVFFDLANGLIEPMQWMRGGEVSSVADLGKKFGANGMNIIFGGGVLEEESKAIQSSLGLIDTPQNYSIPFYKQGDTVRFVTQKALAAGPAFINTAAQIYNTNNMPSGRGLSGVDKLKQPLSMQLLKAAGVFVAVMGTKKQKEYRLLELDKRNDELDAELNSVGFQREGSPTGPLQEPYDKEKVKAKLKAEILRNKAEIDKIKGSKVVENDNNGKIDLLNVKNLFTPHL